MNWWEDFANWVAGTAKTVVGGVLEQTEGVTRNFAGGVSGLEASTSNPVINKNNEVKVFQPAQQTSTVAANLIKTGSEQSGTGTGTVFNILSTVPRTAGEYAGAAALANPLAGQDLGFSEALALTRGDRTNKMWYESGNDPITLGQSIYGTAQDSLGGDKIDWADKDAVDKYFSSGAAMAVSGTIDAAATIGFDPLTYVAPIAKAGRLAYLVRAVSNEKKVAQFADEIDQAVLHLADPASAPANGWSSFFKFVLDNPRASVIQMRSNVYESTNPLDLSSALASAGEAKDVNLIADIAKAAIGDWGAVSRLRARRDSIAVQIQQHNIKLDTVSSKIDKAVNADADPAKIAKLKEAEKTMIAEMAPVIEQNRVLVKAVGTADVNTKELTDVGVEFQMRGRTVMKSAKWEEYRNKAAISRAETQYGTEAVRSVDGTVYEMADVTVDGIGMRMMAWLSPSGVIGETPSGNFNLGGIGSKESFREMSAIARHMTLTIKKDYSDAVNMFAAQIGKAEQKVYLEALETRINADLITHVVTDGDTAKELTKLQLKHVQSLASQLVNKRQEAVRRAFTEIIDNNYIVLDETGDPVIVKQIKAYLTKLAEANGHSLEQEVELLRGNAQYSGQVSSFYNFMDIDATLTHLKENAPALKQLLKHLDTITPALESGVKRSASQTKAINQSAEDIIKEIVEASSKRFELGVGVKANATAVGQRLSKNGRIGLELATDVLDGFYGNLWKPITLLSGKYAARNVLEGWGRGIAYLDELAGTSGESRFKIAQDWLDTPQDKVAILTENLGARLGARAGFRKLQNNRTETLAKIRKQDVFLNGSAEDAAKVLVQTDDIIKSLSRVKDKEVVDAIALIRTKTATAPALKDRAARAAFDFLLEGNDAAAVKALYTGENLSDTVNDLAAFRKLIDDTVDALEVPLKNGTLADKHPENITEGIDKLYKGLKTVAESLEVFSTNAVMRAAAAGDWDKLIAGAQPILRRSGAETFEVIPGVAIPDWAAGQLGKFARQESSADATYVKAIQDSNRLIGQSVLEQNVRNAKVTGDNTKWSGAYADFINGDLKSDRINYMILQGSEKSEIKNWFMSPSADQYRGNLNLKATSADFEEQFALKSLLIDRYLPEVPGMERGYLKSKALAGDLTREEAALIPLAVRPTVAGSDSVNATGIASAFAIYKKSVTKLFRAIGSMPETTLVRHPFYRAVYRTEARRITKIMQAQGVDLQSQQAIDTVVRVAHRTAMKTLNETLYNISRYTDPAKALRFASPFYMSQQNSNRYWLGQAVKNPTVPYVGYLSWNVLNDVFEVIDEDGNPVESSLPFGANETLRLNVPEWIFGGEIAGNEYFDISKTSLDLINQGSIPLIPQMSGALVSVPVNYLLDWAANRGKPIPEMLTDLGFDGDTFEKRILPYFDPYASNDILTAAVPQSAWMRAAKNAFGGENNAQFAARMNLMFEKIMLDYEMSGVKPTRDMITDAMAQATNDAKMSYLLESITAFGSPASVKLNSSQTVLHQTYRRYVSEYGNVDGYMNYVKDFGPIKAAYASSSLSQNNSSLFATPQTQGNLNRNKRLAQNIAQFGDEGIAMFGEMFNEGDPEDYSKVVNEYFYSTKINGVPLKEQAFNLAAAEAKRKANIGWSYYIPAKEELIASAKAAGVEVGSAEWDRNYAPVLSKITDLIAEQYPDWYIAKGTLNTVKGNIRYGIVQAVVSDKKFMDSIGKRKPVWQAAKIWVSVRTELSDVLAARVAAGGSANLKAASNSDIVKAMEGIAASIGQDKRYIGFTAFYEKYLSNDDLLKVRKP